MNRLGALLPCLLTVALSLAGCSSGASQAAPANLLEQAAREATAIVQQAQATAVVLQAQAQATAVMQEVLSKGNPTPIPEATWRANLPTPVFGQTPAGETQEIELESGAAITNTVEVVSVGTAGDGGFIIVRFYAPPEEAEKWWQGSVSVEDETSGALYNEIPVMPKIGPLIGRPKLPGQIGYVMLVNAPPGLPGGARVTVKLGNYVFEHIPVQ